MSDPGATFLPGLELAHAYYDEVVRALVGDIPHAAARLGWGSDTLGYDTARSVDHGWGPRVQIFVARDRVAALRTRVSDGLPDEFRGWPTHYGWDEVVPRHWVEIQTLDDWLLGHLGVDPRPSPSTLDWLTIPQQLLLGVTCGAVFHDPRGELADLRGMLAWYPDDVWRYLLACQWQRIGQIEPFVGRCAEVGDELGSRILASTLAHDFMLLAFIIERKYAPYPKWFGTAFAQLDAGREIIDPLEAAVTATDHAAREASLVAVAEALARRFNGLELMPALDPKARRFYERPFLVIDAPRFAVACRATIDDPELRALPLVGSINQFSDSTDLLSGPSLAFSTRAVYGSD